MMFKVRYRATIVQGPEGFNNNYNEGDEVIIETTFEDGFSHAKIVGPVALKTPSADAFRKVDDGTIKIDLPALRAAMKTIEEHADLIDACFREHASPDAKDRKFARLFVSGLWFLVVDGWRPQDEPRSVKEKI